MAQFDRINGLSEEGVRDAADLTLQKFAELHSRGQQNGRPAAAGCSQTFELRHCYWCGKGNCVNPAWPLWFCHNGGHPNG